MDVWAGSHFYIGWLTADSFGRAGGDVLVPKADLFCGAPCNYSATVSVDMWQYSGLQLDPGYQSVPVTISPSVNLRQTNFTSNSVTVTAAGSGLAPGGYIRVLVSNPTTGDTWLAWPIAGADGTFSVDIAVPTSELAGACRSAELSYQILQYSVPQYQSPSYQVAVGDPSLCPVS